MPSAPPLICCPILAEGASAGIVWEGYDSQYVEFNPTTGGNDPPNWSYWGLFAVDDINAAVKTYTPRKGFYTAGADHQIRAPRRAAD